MNTSVDFLSVLVSGLWPSGSLIRTSSVYSLKKADIKHASESAVKTAGKVALHDMAWSYNWLIEKRILRCNWLKHAALMKNDEVETKTLTDL